MVIILSVAIAVCSCKDKLSKADKLNIAETPVQVIDNMEITGTDKGVLQMRIKTKRMEKYKTDSSSYDLFPMGIEVYAYNIKGELETTIKADKAVHENKNNSDEIWKAYGHVVVNNLIKRQTMETDTLYWDKYSKKIYTDCYIRLYSPDGLMQGFGMTSDERGANASIMRPFNSYTVIIKDTTSVQIDSINFIGPLLKTR